MFCVQTILSSEIKIRTLKSWTEWKTMESIVVSVEQILDKMTMPRSIT